MTAGIATTVGVAVTGATTWVLMGEDGNDEKGSESTSESDQNTTGNDIDEDGEAPEASKEDVQNQSEQPEAANPDPDPQGPETNESAINKSAATEEPTSDDVAISGTELTTETNAATVTGTATNEADEPLTLDLEVQFLQEGEQLGRSWTRDLPDSHLRENQRARSRRRGYSCLGATERATAKRPVLVHF